MQKLHEHVNLSLGVKLNISIPSLKTVFSSGDPADVDDDGKNSQNKLRFLLM